MAFGDTRFDPQSAAEKAVSAIGFGYDLSTDICLSGCKPGPSGLGLIDEVDRTLTKDLVLPGGVVVPNVSASIKCDKGELTRFRSDVLSFDEMSEQFNQDLSLSGKIPCGLFNSMFSFVGCWQKDAAATKSLAFDGWSITLYNIELAKSQIVLSEHVKNEVPASWDPAVLAECRLILLLEPPVGLPVGGSGNHLATRGLMKFSVFARRRPWRDCLPPPSHHPWPIGAPARPVEGHRAKRKPFEVKSTLIGVESSLVRSVSKQISHSHSPHRRLTVGSAFPTRSGRVSDEIGARFRRASEKEAPIRDPQIISDPETPWFIEKYGTHVVVGVKMGGKDVIHIKQLQNSNLQPTEVQKLLKQLADERFSKDINGSFTLDSNKLSGKLKDEHNVTLDLQSPFMTSMVPSAVSHSKNDDILSIHVRRGGIDNGQSHSDWLSTVSQSPNVISMSFIPIASLLNGVHGSGFLSHAINLYLRYKPPMEELHQFLEFQLPRQWAPVYSDLPLAPRPKRQVSPSLQFSFMGPRLYVNTSKVDSRNRPVTGIRLYLEGKRSDHLAVHLQHLSTLPQILQLSDDPSYKPIEPDCFEPVKWSIFSHVCTTPVQYEGARIDESASIVTKAWFEVKLVGMNKVLFLRLGFSAVASARIRRSEWDGPMTSSRKSGFMSVLTITKLEKPPKVVVLNSAVYPGGPPVPTRAPKLMYFVDTEEMVRGPEVPPGYWVVTGAKLCVEGGRITIKVKYSLLTILLEASLM
ncbi:MAC/Perforin domain-containing protein [Actinidia rufa]|uniref:MAC/Perforin domain-containing protein n=1 Tax=Actinidia rufa TaxID=165716 RepID=A0A7J0EZM6_9ERIC|nr:MAC/Perforin domain-containing protein [Actinidia rufa]